MSFVAEPVDTAPTTIPPSPPVDSHSISDDDRAEALKLKAQANKAFQNHFFEEAVKLYSDAIDKNPLDATLWCNRAFTRMKLDEFGYAIDDASRAIDIDPKYVKAYYRRGMCRIAILRPQAAIADFKKVVALEPVNKAARVQLDTTSKLVRRIQFERAIEVGQAKSAVEECLEMIRDGGCKPDSASAAPVLPILEDGPEPTYTITADFIDKMIDWFKAGKFLPKRWAWEIVLGCWKELAKEESLTEVVLEEGVTCDVIGDTHGQFYDLLHLLDLTGRPSETHCLLFNGDFVDRGSWSVENALLLFAFKWLYPHRVFLNRGNHEAEDMNKVYGFEGEVRHKHGELTYKLFSNVFTYLPLATLISPALPPSVTTKSTAKPLILSPEGRKRYFVVHGGIFSRDGVTLDEIRKIKRTGRQPGNEGLMCELLWTDPQEKPGWGPSKRGVGVGFGPDVTRRWCELNGITGILRSHEVRHGGYAVEHDGLCTTVFSAPNYCDQVGNKGAYVRIDARGEQSYFTFDAKPHPPMKPMAYSSGLSNMMM